MVIYYERNQNDIDLVVRLHSVEGAFRSIHTVRLNTESFLRFFSTWTIPSLLYFFSSFLKFVCVYFYFSCSFYFFILCSFYFCFALLDWINQNIPRLLLWARLNFQRELICLALFTNPFWFCFIYISTSFCCCCCWIRFVMKLQHQPNWTICFIWIPLKLDLISQLFSVEKRNIRNE